MWKLFYILCAVLLHFLLLGGVLVMTYCCFAILNLAGAYFGKPAALVALAMSKKSSEALLPRSLLKNILRHIMEISFGIGRLGGLSDLKALRAFVYSFLAL